MSLFDNFLNRSYGLPIYGIVRFDFGQPIPLTLTSYFSRDIHYIEGIYYSLMYPLYDYSGKIGILKKGVNHTYQIIKL